MRSVQGGALRRSTRRSGQADTPRDAVEWAREATERGAGEILLTSIDRDGTKAGFDCELTAAVSDAVNIPVIASGGAGTFEHFAEVFTAGRADAALAASIFHFNEKSVSELKQFLNSRQIPRSAYRNTESQNHEVSRNLILRVSSVLPCEHSDPMLIPSIDLQGGRVVQLVQGDKLAIASDDLDGWIAKFSTFPKVQLIDLDAAMSRGNNDALVRQIAARLPCRVGGGVRSVRRAEELIAAGAQAVIAGSGLFRRGDGGDLSPDDRSRLRAGAGRHGRHAPR